MNVPPGPGSLRDAGIAVITSSSVGLFSGQSHQRCRAKSSGTIFDYNLSGSLRQTRDSPLNRQPVYFEVPCLRAGDGRSLNTSDFKNLRGGISLLSFAIFSLPGLIPFR